MPWKSVEYSVQEIAASLGASVVYSGTPHNVNAAGLSGRTIARIASLDDCALDAVSFCRSAPKKPLTCGAMLCSSEVAEKIALHVPCIVVENPIRAMVKTMPLFFEPDVSPCGVHPSAVVDPSARIASTASVGALSVIGAGVVIGEHAVIHPHVCLYARVKVGARVTIHAQVVVREDTELADGVTLQPGAVIGADGFGFLPDPPNGLITVPQIGGVLLGAGVEIGANSCVDRATLGRTVIETGTKVDNLVQIGHNVQIGAHSILCGQVGIGGSAIIGSRAVIGGSAGVADHIKITDNVRLAAKTGVIQDIAESGDYGGYPAVPAREWLKAVMALRELPNRLRKLAGQTNQQE